MTGVPLFTRTADILKAAYGPDWAPCDMRAHLATIARASAMRRLGLPRPWDHRSVAWHTAAHRDPLRYAGLFSP